MAGVFFLSRSLQSILIVAPPNHLIFKHFNRKYVTNIRMLNTLVWQTHANCTTYWVYSELILHLSCWHATLPQDLSSKRNIAGVAVHRVA